MNIRGIVRMQVINPDGTRTDTGFKENVITYTGLAGFAGLAGNTGAISPFIYLAVGTDATAASASQTALIAELSTLGLSRTTATITRSTTNQTNDTLQLDYTWTATGSTTVNEIGVFNAASTGIMAARKVTGGQVLTNGALLVVTYKIIFA